MRINTFLAVAVVVIVSVDLTLNAKQRDDINVFPQPLDKKHAEESDALLSALVFAFGVRGIFGSSSPRYLPG